MLRALDRLLGHIAGALTSVYRWAYSRRLPRVCCYHPSCSVYAALAWTRRGLFGGMGLVVERLRRCSGGPFLGDDFPPGVVPFPAERDPGPRIIDELELRRLELRGAPRFHAPPAERGTT